MPNNSIFGSILEHTNSGALRELKNKFAPESNLGKTAAGASMGAGTTPITHNPINPANPPIPEFTVIIRQSPKGKETRTKVVKALLPENFGINTTADWDTPFAGSVLGDGKMALLAQLAGVNPTVQALTAHFWKGAQPTQLSLPLVFVAYSGPEDILRPLVTLKSMATPTKNNLGFLLAPGPQIDIDYSKLKSAMSGAGDALGKAYQDVKQLGGNLFQSMLPGSTPQPAPGADDGKKASEAAPASLEAIQKDVAQANKAIESMFIVKGKISVQLGKFFILDDVIINSIDENTDVVLDKNGRPLKTTVTVNFTTRVTPTFENLMKQHFTTADMIQFEGGK